MLAPSGVPDELLRQDLREHHPVHVKLGPHELQLIRVAVVPDLFGLRDRLEPGGGVAGDERRRIAVPPMPVGDHVGEDPRVADEFLVRDAGEHRNGELDRGKRVEQFAVLDQRNPRIVQVLALVDAARINPAVDPDHQVERQPVLVAQLGDRPKHPPREGRAMGRVGRQATPEHLVKGHLGAAVPDRGRLEIGGQRDRTGPRPGGDEVPEPLLERRPQARKRTVELDPGTGREPLSRFRFTEVEHQVVGAETRDVRVGIKAFERVVEIVGQEDRFHVALIEHRTGPLGRGHLAFRRVVQRFPVRRVDPVPVEPEKGPANLDQPAVLGRVLERPQALDEPSDQFTRGERRVLDPRLRHPRGVRQFGVVVIAQQIRQGARSGRVRVDVRVGVDQADSGERLVDRCLKGVRHGIR